MTPPLAAAMFVGDRMMASSSLDGAAAVFPACTVTTMHFRHRQTDTEIVAQARDVYITSPAKNQEPVMIISVLIVITERIQCHEL